MKNTYVDLNLTEEEILYIAKACASMPESEKDENIIKSLQKKLNKHRRFAKYRELFGNLH